MLPPKVQPEAAIVEFAEFIDNGFAMLIEICCPLPKREKIAEAIVKHFLHPQRRHGHFVEEIVKNEKRMISAVNVFYHER